MKVCPWKMKIKKKNKIKQNIICYKFQRKKNYNYVWFQITRNLIKNIIFLNTYFNFWCTLFWIQVHLSFCFCHIISTILYIFRLCGIRTMKAFSPLVLTKEESDYLMFPKEATRQLYSKHSIKKQCTGFVGLHRFT